VAARCEKVSRRNTVIRHDVSQELHQREVGETGWASDRVLAYWLRITPPEPRRRPRHRPLVDRTALTGEV